MDSRILEQENLKKELEELLKKYSVYDTNKEKLAGFISSIQPVNERVEYIKNLLDGIYDGHIDEDIVTLQDIFPALKQRVATFFSKYYGSDEKNLENIKSIIDFMERELLRLLVTRAVKVKPLNEFYTSSNLYPEEENFKSVKIQNIEQENNSVRKSKSYKLIALADANNFYIKHDSNISPFYSDEDTKEMFEIGVELGEYSKVNTEKKNEGKLNVFKEFTASNIKVTSKSAILALFEMSDKEFLKSDGGEIEIVNKIHYHLKVIMPQMIKN